MMAIHMRMRANPVCRAARESLNYSPMGTYPQSYRSLPVQVAERIRREIQAHTWVSLLPGERALTDTLRVSRKTLRKALALLQNHGVIENTHGVRRRIVLRAGPNAHPESTVGLITPDSLENLPPYTTLWVNALRVLLLENRLRHTIFVAHRIFRPGPDKALARLVEQNPQACWVLTHSNEFIQKWFLNHSVPCVVAGSCSVGLRLPNIDLDYFAVCRHAAGAMLRRGHRRIAFVTDELQRMGDIESELGFLDGVRRSAHSDVEPLVSRHDGTVSGALHIIERLFSLSTPPTALLIAKPAYYLTTIAFLAQRGLSVPRHVSLVSRDYDRFLSYLTPPPACYSFSPELYARRLFPLVVATMHGQPITQPSQRILPRFVMGSSLGPPM
jgi:LacI family transcriptional regulator